MALVLGAMLRDSVRITDSLSVKIRNFYSLQHIQSAALFTRQAYLLEKSYNGTFSEELFADNKAYATEAIIATVAFLEASINELFSDAVDNYESEQIKQLDTNTKQLMAEMWKLDVPKTAAYNILQKYQIALTLARRPLFDLGKPPTQDIKFIIKIRNDLIHFEPAWITALDHDISVDTSSYQTLQQEKKFPINALYAATQNPFFPDKCLGYGCAKWAVNTSIKFVEEFYSRMGIPSPINHLKHRLNTEP
jgi:hypothetical protein